MRKILRFALLVTAPGLMLLAGGLVGGPVVQSPRSEDVKLAATAPTWIAQFAWAMCARDWSLIEARSTADVGEYLKTFWERSSGARCIAAEVIGSFEHNGWAYHVVAIISARGTSVRFVLRTDGAAVVAID